MEGGNGSVTHQWPGHPLEHPLCHGDIGHTCTSEESLPFQEGC